MAKYVEVYLLPIPAKNLKAYVKLARVMGRLFLKHGALAYREYNSSDHGTFGPLLLAGRLNPRKGEILIYGAVEYRSEKHRDQVAKKAMSDPKFMKSMPNPPLFDFKRMGFGGFKQLVDLS